MKYFLPLLFLLSSSSSRASGEPGTASWSIKPYRVLLVVERWNDPSSVLVDHERDEFQPVAALLKAWSIPYDILRLDQQHLDSTYLLDRFGQVRYGAVVWLADLPSYNGQNVASLTEAAAAGTSLLVAKSRFLDSALEGLLGLKFKEAYTATDPLQVTQPHFITRELASQNAETLNVSWDFSTRMWVEARGAEVLVDQNHHPVLTLNRHSAGSSAIWIGVPALALLRDSGYWRGLFFRSLLWSLGYLVGPNLDYSRQIEMEIDDWGTSDKGYLSYWRYQTPKEETIRENLIAPLQKSGAIVSANVITGYVDRKSKRILSPWSQKFTDLFGVQQDYASTQRGLKAAVAAGVLEIQSHGWTHMQPDLESLPGPWWTAELAGEASADGWYTEFEDQRRGTEVPAIVQLVHMKRSIQYLWEDFAQRPLELRPGGAGWSKSYMNQTGRLAAQAGFGVFHGEPNFYYYLDRDLVLDMTGIAPHEGAAFDRPLHADQWPAHPDGPVMLVFHDRDVSLRLGYLEQLFASLPNGWGSLSTNRYIGILHTQIESSTADGWQLAFSFEEPYCAYFANHSSSWRLLLADPLVEKLKVTPSLSVSVDGKAPAKFPGAELLGGTVAINIPAGLGRHVWKLGPVP